MDSPQGGARLIALLARDLQEMGEEVTLYCYKYDPERCFPEVLKGVTLKCVERVAVGSAGAGAEVGLGRVRRQLWRYYWEARALASLIRPETDILNPHEWLAHRSAALFSRRYGAPVVWTYNDPSAWHLHRDGRWRHLPYQVFGWFDTRQVNRFAAVTTLSQWMTVVARQAFDVSSHMIRCGVDACALRSPRGVREPREGLHLLSVGVLFPHRRLEDVIRAVGMVRDAGCECTFEIIGSDRFHQGYGVALRTLIGDLGLDSVVEVRFAAIDETDLEDAFARADVFVFANEQQAWGLAPLEAMLRNLPVIVSRGAGVSEVLVDRQTALLVDPRHPDQLASAILELVGSPELRQRLGEQGKELVLSAFTSKRYAEQMLALFREYAGQRLATSA